MTLAAAVVMGLGVLAVLRAVILVAGDAEGRFRSDAWVSLLVGFALIFLGRLLLPGSGG